MGSPNSRVLELKYAVSICLQTTLISSSESNLASVDLFFIIHRSYHTETSFVNKKMHYFPNNSTYSLATSSPIFFKIIFLNLVTKGSMPLTTQFQLFCFSHYLQRYSGLSSCSHLFFLKVSLICIGGFTCIGKFLVQQNQQPREENQYCFCF